MFCVTRSCIWKWDQDTLPADLTQQQEASGNGRHCWQRYPLTGAVPLPQTRQHLFFFPDSLWSLLPYFPFSLPFLGLKALFCGSLDRSEAEMLRVCREGTLHPKETPCFLSTESSSQLAARELMRLACLLIFSSPLWPASLEKHRDRQGQLRGPRTEFQIDGREKSAK